MIAEQEEESEESIRCPNSGKWDRFCLRSNLSRSVRAPPLVGSDLGLQQAALYEPLPLLVHNLGWSSSESFQSPRRRTCPKGFPETESDLGEGLALKGTGFVIAISRVHCGEVNLFRTDFWNGVGKLYKNQMAMTTNCQGQEIGGRDECSDDREEGSSERGCSEGRRSNLTSLVDFCEARFCQ